MVLVFTDEVDQTTNDILDCLIYYGVQYVLVMPQDPLELLFIDLNKKIFKLKIGNEIINSEAIRSAYYRKGYFSLDKANVSSVEESEGVHEYLDNESFKLIEYLFYLIETKVRFAGNFSLRDPNKLVLLQIAQEVGLNIPDSIITTRKKEIEMFMRNNTNKVITKAISESYLKVKDGVLYYGYTTQINKDHIDEISHSFYESLFQEFIIREFEIRVFFIENKLYPTALLIEEGHVDYRSDYDKVNRMIPYKLPLDIEHKLLGFIKKSRLNTGSIDMILDKNGNYYFLEVNPNGQFGYLSYMCNYYLENVVTNYLLDKNT